VRDMQDAVRDMQDAVRDMQDAVRDMQDTVRDMQDAVRDARAQFLRRRTELLEDSVLQFCFRTEILTVGKPLRQCRTLTLTSAMLRERACFQLGRRRRTLVFEGQSKPSPPTTGDPRTAKDCANNKVAIA